MQEYSTSANDCSQGTVAFLQQLVARNLESVFAAHCPKQVEPKRLDEKAKALILSCGEENIRRLAWKYADGSYDRFEELFSIGMLGLCEAALTMPADVANPIGYLIHAAKHDIFDELRRIHASLAEHAESLDAPFSEDGSFSLYDVLPDRSSLTPTLRRIRALNGALQRLTPRQRAAVRRRAGLPGCGSHSLAEMAKSMRATERAVHDLDYQGRRNLARDPRLCKVMGVTR